MLQACRTGIFYNISLLLFGCDASTLEIAEVKLLIPYTWVTKMLGRNGRLAVHIQLQDLLTIPNAPCNETH